MAIGYGMGAELGQQDGLASGSPAGQGWQAAVWCWGVSEVSASPSSSVSASLCPTRNPARSSGYPLG